MGEYKILAINPGSTSTKLAVFKGKECLFSKNVAHEASVLKEFKEIAEQIPYREETILNALAESNVDVSDCDAFVGRGGGLLAVEGGTYDVNDILLDHAYRGANGITHPAQLGPVLANRFAEKYGKKAYVVNPPDTDEMQDVARMTGVKDVYRTMHLHTLNLKETAIQHSNAQGKKYEDCNYIVCHIGGGVSISAHRHGKMIDGNDIVSGEGPMAPTRCGSLQLSSVVNMLKNGMEPKELLALSMKTGGFVSHLGTSDAIEVTKRMEAGDKHAEMVWNGFIYQIEKNIGAMACALGGKVDAILLGGGIVHSKDLVSKITECCSWIAPVYAYPGEFEMEAMASGVTRVLDGVEECKTYTGKPSWTGFDF